MLFTATTAVAVTAAGPATAARAAEAAPRPAEAAGGAGARPSLAAFDLSEVRLLESPFLANMRRTCEYLLFVDADRLLHTFRRTVGLPSTAEPCGGWEAPDVQLRGHTMGHLLSGLAQAHAATGDSAYADKGGMLVTALARCQRAAPAAGFTPGYLSAFPESVFDQLEAGGKPWAPYYTLHKIMAGLLDQYRLSGNREALEVLREMAAWAEARTAPLSYGPLVLAGEYGDTELATVPTIRPRSLRPVTGISTRFTALADGRSVALRPFHEVHHQRYNVYWAVTPRRGRARDVAHYPFDEATGAAADRTGTFPDATISPGAGWEDDGTGPAVSLDGSGGHVALPAGLLSGLDEVTISVRVRVDALAASARVFDFGYHKDTYLFLAATTGAGRARAALKIAGMEREDFVDATGPLPLGRWTHIALTLGGGTGVLYLDGAEAGRNPAMVASPLLLGRTTRSFLGRSQNSTHPYLRGAVRDLRVHNRALTASDVARLATG
ncbi:beta-L-arabinofuranosidase domain-containing protein [Streptomyces sp. NPDC002740]